MLPLELLDKLTEDPPEGVIFPLELLDELLKFPPDEELEDELELDEDDEGQSAKPKQLSRFVGQQPFIQQRGPHCV